jgi:hypothetical protein
VKYVLIVVAAVVGLVALLLFLTVSTHIFDDHRRVGHFDVYYASSKTADGSGRLAIYYKRHQLSDKLSGYSIDPNNPDRISYWSDDIARSRERCGTFLYDGRLGLLKRIRRRPVVVYWSLDSRFMLLDYTEPVIFDVATGTEVDLTDAVSKTDGTRVNMQAIQLSPDGERVALLIQISSDMDLVEVTVASLDVRYIATVREFPVWTDEDIRWSAGRLELTVSATPQRPIMVVAPENLGWTATAPTAARKPNRLDTLCEQ